MIIDSHCHLDEYYDAPANVEGVNYCLAICCDNIDRNRFMNFLDKTSNVFGALGIHPAYADKFDKNEIEQYLNHEKIVGYGEIGLEYHYDDTPRDVQIKVLEEHLY